MRHAELLAEVLASPTVDGILSAIGEFQRLNGQHGTDVFLDEVAAAAPVFDDRLFSILARQPQRLRVVARNSSLTACNIKALSFWLVANVSTDRSCVAMMFNDFLMKTFEILVAERGLSPDGGLGPLLVKIACLREHHPDAIGGLPTYAARLLLTFPRLPQWYLARLEAAANGDEARLAWLRQHSSFK